MQQVFQQQRSGSFSLDEVPPPACRRDGILVALRASLISSGTERRKAELGGKSLLAKARARPDLVAQVLERARVEGLAETAQPGPRAPRRPPAARLLGRRDRRRDRPAGPGPAGRPDGGGRGRRLRQPRRGLLGAGQPGRAGARESGSRARLLRHGRRHRPAGHPPGVAHPRRDRRRRRPRPGRAADHTPAPCLRPSGGRHRRLARRRSGPRRAAPAGRRLDTRGPRPGGRSGRAHRGAWAGRGARDGRDPVQRPGPAGGPAAARSRPGRGGRRRRPGPRARPAVREGAGAAAVALLRPGPLRPGLRGARGRLPGRVRPLDRAAQPGRGRAAAGDRAAAGRRPDHPPLPDRRGGRGLPHPGRPRDPQPGHRAHLPGSGPGRRPRASPCGAGATADRRSGGGVDARRRATSPPGSWSRRSGPTGACGSTPS